MQGLLRWVPKFLWPRKFHNRADGPVVIDPERRHIIHIYGKSPEL